MTAASWRGETACGGAAGGECGRQQRAESLHSYRSMSTRAAATSRAAWSRVVARTSRAERSRHSGAGARRDLALVGAVEVADGALSVGNQRQPLRSGCIYGKLSAIRGHQGHQLQHHDVKASGDCHDDVLIETAGGTVSESATLVTLGPTAWGFNRKRLADTGVDGSSLA